MSETEFIRRVKQHWFSVTRQETDGAYTRIAVTTGDLWSIIDDLKREIHKVQMGIYDRNQPYPYHVYHTEMTKLLRRWFGEAPAAPPVTHASSAQQTQPKVAGESHENIEFNMGKPQHLPPETQIAIDKVHAEAERIFNDLTQSHPWINSSPDLYKREVKQVCERIAYANLVLQPAVDTSVNDDKTFREKLGHLLKYRDKISRELSRLGLMHNIHPYRQPQETTP